MSKSTLNIKIEGDSKEVERLERAIEDGAVKITATAEVQQDEKKSSGISPERIVTGLIVTTITGGVCI